MGAAEVISTGELSKTSEVVYGYVSLYANSTVLARLLKVKPWERFNRLWLRYLSQNLG
jgi:hypothetical protein